MKTKIFIDLDETIFDTLKFKEKLYSIFEKTGATKDEIDKSYSEECADFKYAPEDNLRRLHTKYDFNFDQVYAELEDIYRYVPECLYNDTIEFLGSLDRDKYEINLLSLGDIDFQRKKFIHTGLEGYFDNVYYCEMPKWDFLKTIVQPEEKFYLIDDRADTMKNVAKMFPNSIPIKISRFDQIVDEFTSREVYDGINVGNLEEAFSYI